MYEQTLYKVLDEHVKPKVINHKNKHKQWEYGYNKEYDMVVISKTGKIGEIYEIQNLKIALDKTYKIPQCIFIGNEQKYKPYFEQNIK